MDMDICCLCSFLLGSFSRKMKNFQLSSIFDWLAMLNQADIGKCIVWLILDNNLFTLAIELIRLKLKWVYCALNRYD